MAASNLRSLIYSNDGAPKLQVLDQLLIPHEKKYIDVPDVETAWSVIREMQIRGAWRLGAIEKDRSFGGGRC
jgi:methylthioribose-1-phosphate isomerase